MRATNEVITLIVYCALVAQQRFIVAQVFDPLDISKSESSASFWVHLETASHLLIGSVVRTYLLAVRVNFLLYF